MRYSIFEYSQERLVSLALDVTDALLLNWFANFFCGKMEKQAFKDADGKTKVYGWIKTSKVIEDLPVIGITSEKGIRNRFDTFVEKGILDRKTFATHNGKKSYYRMTAIYDSLINTTAIQKAMKKRTPPQENHARGQKTKAQTEFGKGNPLPLPKPRTPETTRKGTPVPMGMGTAVPLRKGTPLPLL